MSTISRLGGREFRHTAFNMNSLLGFLFILALCSELGTGAEMPDTPIVTYSPPEGNTTFIDGTTWCIASSQANQQDLQEALDWACGPGLADCSAIQPGQPCYQADNLALVASYAFNTYYQTNGDSPIACNFGGTGVITSTNPSYGSCQFQSSGNTASDSSSPSLPYPGVYTWLMPGILVLDHLMIAIDRGISGR
ncbi:hypothetical protein SUGI_1150580 [Cryptomeria japonica]|nr:hypothetical protein SUGI_1150580 [Cryptomeria japonica]